MLSHFKRMRCTWGEVIRPAFGTRIDCSKGLISRTSCEAAFIAARISSATFSDPMLLKAPASLPAARVCPPSNSLPSSREASGIIASTVRASVGWFWKKTSGTRIRASSTENRRKLSTISSASSDAIVARVSKSDVLWGRSVLEFPPLTALTNS